MTVHVVREARENVLAVPVQALVALLEGGYAVEVVDAAGATHLVAVDLALRGRLGRGPRHGPG